VARELQKAVPEAEVCSVVQALQAGQLTVCADRVGFVFPMHYFGLPLLAAMTGSMTMCSA